MTYTISHVIFDLDGTVLDTEFEVSRITAQLANESGCAITAEDVFLNYAGLGAREKFVAIAKDQHIQINEATFDRLGENHEERKAALYTNPDVPAMPGIESALDKISQHGYLLSIASSNTSERSKNGLAHTGLDRFFKSRVYGSDNVGGKKKPEPHVFLLAMALNKTNATQSIIVEDTLAGIVAAKNANTRVIGYLDPRLGDGPEAQKRIKAMRNAGAISVIRDFAKLDETIEMILKPAARPAVSAAYNH